MSRLLKSLHGRLVKQLDVVVTAIVQFAVLAVQMWLYRWAAEQWGDAGFAEYSLARRLISFIHAVLFQVAGLAVMRQGAAAAAREDATALGSGFAAATLIVGSFCGLLMLPVLAAPAAIAELCFGDPEQTDLLWPSAGLITGLAIHSLCYDYFRATMSWIQATALQCCTLIVLPVVSFVIWSESAAIGMTRMAQLSTVTSLLVLGSVWLSTQRRWSRILGDARSLLGYAGPRIPGAIAYFSLISAPAFITVHASDAKTAGLIAFATTMLTLSAGLMSPMTVWLMPATVQKIERGETAELIHMVGRLRTVLLLLSIVYLVAVQIVLDPVLHYGMKLQVDSILPLRINLLSLPGFVLFTCMRPILDAGHQRAVNSHNCYWSVGMFGLVLATGWMFVDRGILVQVAFAAAMTTLAVLTEYSIRRMVIDLQAKPATNSVPDSAQSDGQSDMSGLATSTGEIAKAVTVVATVRKVEPVISAVPECAAVNEAAG